MKRKRTDDEADLSLTAKKSNRVIIEDLSDTSRLKKLMKKVTSSSASLIPPLIFDHAQFGEIIHDAKNGVDAKLAVLKLLKACFISSEINPETAMNDVHVPLLFGAYGATLSESDQILYDIFRLYERNREIDFSKYYPIVWGRFGLSRYDSLKSLGPTLWNRPTPDDVLKCLDARLMKESCRKLPLQITIDAVPSDSPQDTCYDPRFLLPLLLTLLEPHSVIDCRRFAIEKSCLGYALSCLSLHDRSLRGIAYAVIFRFRYYLRDQAMTSADSKARFLERPQLLYILNLLRQSIDRPSPRIPSIITVFLCRAVQLTAMPWDTVYSPINRYLLLKPQLDLWDVPEFYKLFQSASSEERVWILKLIADGLREAMDYRICERRNVFTLLMAFYDWAAYNSNAEDPSRREILKIISAACGIGSAAADLCYRYNLIGWLNGAVRSIKSIEDALEFASILRLLHENVSKKETVPQYVRILWGEAAAVVRKRALERAAIAGEEGQLENSDAWMRFLSIVGER